MTEPMVDRPGPHDQGAVLASRAFESSQRRFTVAALLLGFGLGGFVRRDRAPPDLAVAPHTHRLRQPRLVPPATDVRSVDENTLWDGAFHACTWLFVLVGLLLMWRVLTKGYGRAFLEALLTAFAAPLVQLGMNRLDALLGREEPGLVP